MHHKHDDLSSDPQIHIKANVCVPSAGEQGWVGTMLGTQAVKSQGSLVSQSSQSASSRFNKRPCFKKRGGGWRNGQVIEGPCCYTRSPRLIFLETQGENREPTHRSCLLNSTYAHFIPTLPLSKCTQIKKLKISYYFLMFKFLKSSSV